MIKTHRPLTAVAALACALLPAAGAQAATKDMTLGLKKSPDGTPEAASLHAWFPKKLKVNVGDKVAFTSYAFGYAAVGKGKLPPMASPDPTTPVSGATGPDGQPFWFNGEPSWRIAAMHLAPTGDKKVTGKGLDASGLSMEDGPPKPYVLKFTKPGAFKVRDGLHPDVAAKVVVVPKGRSVPSEAADEARATRQAARLLKTARRLDDVEPAAGTILAGNDRRNVGFYRFFGTPTTVAAGQEITLRTGRRALDVHNLVIGPMDWLEDQSPYVFDPPNFLLSATAIYPSQPATPPTFDGTQNGGFVNTGTVDADPRTPLPRKRSLVITKPGTYTYYCMFHAPDMSGTITVE